MKIEHNDFELHGNMDGENGGIEDYFIMKGILKQGFECFQFELYYDIMMIRISAMIIIIQHSVLYLVIGSCVEKCTKYIILIMYCIGANRPCIWGG